MSELADIDRALKPWRGRSTRGAGAAVALVFRLRAGGGLELLFIHRAEAEGDRWSGHMAFPGGKIDPSDLDTRAAAVRETSEEIGLTLEGRSVHLGCLSPVLTLKPRRARPMFVEPHVFALMQTPALTLGHEVQSVVWIPWDFLADAAERGSFERRVGRVPVRFGCYRFEGRLIWGLTYQMISDLRRRLGSR